MTAQPRYRKRWTRLDGVMALRLPDGRYGVAMAAAGAWCPCEEGRAECWWSAVFSTADADDPDATSDLGFWNDIIHTNWHHTTERDARLALEDEFFPPDHDVKMAASHRYNR